MMSSGEKVMIMLGEAFFEASEEEATEFCEAEVDKHQERIDELEEEEEEIVREQKELKGVLYGRFGKSINLEDK